MTIQSPDSLKARPRQETGPQPTRQTSVESIAALLAELVAVLSPLLGERVAQCAGLKEWSTFEELADWLGVDVAALRWMRQTGQGPRAHRVGKHLKVRRVDAEDWLAARADPPAGQ